jgi:hypothetical protein
MWAKLWTKIKGWLFYEELEDVIKLEDEPKPVKRALPLTPVTTPLSNIWFEIINYFSCLK